MLVAVPAPAEEATQVLRGLVFLPGLAAFKPDGIPQAVAPIDVSRVKPLDRRDFAASMGALIGQPLTEQTLQGIPALTQAAMARNGHPAISVAIPDQDTASGIIQVVVTEYTVGKVTIEGEENFGSSLYLDAIGIQAGDVLDMDRIEEGLRQINMSEYRSADVSLEPGDDPDKLDVVVRAQDRLPISVAAGYNNAGPLTTGRDQYSFDINLANTVGALDDIVGYTFVTSNFNGKAPALFSHALTYTLALPVEGTFSLFADYALTRPPGNGNLMSTNGQTLQASPRYTRQVLGSPDLSLSVQLGYDFKSTNNNLLFGGTTITNESARISQFEFGSIVGRTDSLGRTDATLVLMVSPGEMMPNNSDAAFRSLSASARARYVYTRLDAARITALPLGFAWWVHAVGQLSSTGLLPTEQLNGGGITSVRGYPTSTIHGDSGWMLSNELRFPAGSPARWLGLSLNDAVTPFLFIDYASLTARSPRLSNPDGTLTSFGPGIRFQLDRYADLSLDMGGQIRIDSGHRFPGQFFDVAVTLRY